MKFDKKHYKYSDIQEFSDEMLMNMEQHLYRVGWISDFIKEGSILDLGCGNGMLSLSYAFNNTRRVVGIDLNIKAIKFCNKFLTKYNIVKSKYKQGLIENFKTTEKFDNIFLCEILEHVEDPTTLLDVAEKHLKPKGIIFITTPEYYGPYGINNSGDIDGEHIHIYKAKKLKKIIKKRGKIIDFQIKQLIYCAYNKGQ